MRFRRIATIALTALTALSLSPVAQAQDGEVHHELPREPVQMLAPNNPEFWNPGNHLPRILSPFGAENIDCASFHGRDYLACKQNGVPLSSLGIPVVSELLYNNGYIIFKHPDYHVSSGAS